MRFRNKQATLLPIYRGLLPLKESKGSYDLLLAPELYLMRREALPVRFAFQARKLALPLLEEIGAGPSWHIELYREGEQWLLFAYDPQEIGEILSQANLPLDRIRRLYFAQQFLPQLDSPLRLGDQRAMNALDETVVSVPLQLLPEPEQARSPEDLRLPERGFSLSFAEKEGSLRSRELYAITAALILLGLFWSIEGFRSRKLAHSLQERVMDASASSPALSQGITRKNILQKYRSIDTKQRKIRQTLRRIGQLTSQKSKLDDLALDPKGYRAILSIDPVDSRHLLRLANEAKLHPRLEGGKLHLQGSWQ